MTDARISHVDVMCRIQYRFSFLIHFAGSVLVSVIILRTLFVV